MPTVQTNDVDTYYERHGEGPPIVFSHGAGLDHRMWDPQVEALTEDYEVITYDVRGHGETPLGSRSEYTVELFAADLHELIEGLELEDPTVVGLSMGGMIAHQYAATYDEIGGLVLAGTRTAEPMFLTERVLGTVITGSMLTVGEWLGPERADQLMEGVQSVMERIYGEEASGHDEQLEAMAEEANDMEQYLTIGDALHNGYTAVDRSAITVPTLVLYGGYETATTEAHAGKLAAEIDDAGIEKLPETGHVSNWDSPELFNEALLDFLTETVGADA